MAALSVAVAAGIFFILLEMFTGTFGIAMGVVVLALGIYMLIKGADVLVEGAAAIAERAGVSKLFIGLSLVAFGTSAPELAVSLISAVKGVGGIAISNVVGSNIANIGLCLGLTLVITGIGVASSTVKYEIPFLIIVTTSFAAMLLRHDPPVITWNDGLILLGFFVIFAYYLFKMAQTDMEVLEKAEHINLSKAIFMTVFGLAGVALGGELTVDSVVDISNQLGLSKSLFGLTVVAIGTSLPELVTSLTAAVKGHPDMSVGNIVGSNIMNILVIIGISSIVGVRLVGDVKMYWVDTSFLMLEAILLMILSLRKRLSKLAGILLLLSYLPFVAFVIMRG